MVTQGCGPDLHACSCSRCRQHPHSAVAREHRVMNQLLALADERLRRLLAGWFAQQRGRGGISHVARITGLARNTVAKGQHELSQNPLSSSRRIRKPGAGRKPVEHHHPGS